MIKLLRRLFSAFHYSFFEWQRYTLFMIWKSFFSPIEKMCIFAVLFVEKHSECLILSIYLKINVLC